MSSVFTVAMTCLLELSWSLGDGLGADAHGVVRRWQLKNGGPSIELMVGR